MRALTINYDEMIAEALEQALEPAGWSLRHAKTPREALAMLDEDPRFNVILLDHLVKDFRFGAQFLREKASRPEVARIPVIVTSDFAFPRAMMKRVVRVLRKPFDLDVLVDTLRRAAEKP